MAIVANAWIRAGLASRTMRSSLMIGVFPFGARPSSDLTAVSAALLARRAAEGARQDISCGPDGSRGDLKRSSNDLGTQASGSRYGSSAFLRCACLL
ncbi:hypothetical protein MicloDRAFT_00050460 [Microvirga lotononidis]|uniref:Uncharacterized protein n=1 Tax=Microvirga lotononidis TaxID=864069 RepID=I4YWW9_9HYPH|nr:hypothetical protein MicloDRAFT_00050460 [Microvirga lotononidis]